jgi:MFS family permease
MAAAYLLFGAGLAAFTPTMMSYVADITPPSHLGRAYSWYTTAVYVGMTFGPAAGGLLGNTWGLGRVFFFSGGLIFISFLIVLFFLPKPVTEHHSDESGASVWASILRLLPNRRLLACLVATAGGCFGFGMFISFLPLHALAEGLTAGHVGFVFAAQALANVLLRIPFGRLSDRVDRGAMTAAGFALFSLALAVIGACRGVVSLTITAAFLGIGMGVGFTALGTLVAEVVPRQERGLAMGLYNSCIYLGMMLSSASMGWVIRHAGYGRSFLLAGAFTLALTAGFLVFYRHASAREAARP